MNRIISGLVTLAFISASAHAATVTRESGDVAVHNGTKFAPLNDQANVSAGDLIRTGKTGRARIALEGGQTIDVGPGRVVRVPKEVDDPRSWYARAPGPSFQNQSLWQGTPNPTPPPSQTPLWTFQPLNIPYFPVFLTAFGLAGMGSLVGLSASGAFNQGNNQVTQQLKQLVLLQIVQQQQQQQPISQ